MEDTNSIAFLIATLGFLGALIGASIPAIISWNISHRERTDRFRLVALEKRMEVHQDAFQIWRKLIFSLNKPKERDEIVLRGQDWWNKNCLYLDAKSRDSFHSSLILAWGIDNSMSVKERRKEFNEINATGKHLIEGVHLPFRGKVESEHPEPK